MSIRSTLKSIVKFEPIPTPATLDATGPSDAYALAALEIPAWQLHRPSWPTWDPQIGAQLGYARLALIYRCVNIVAHALGTATIRVYDEAKDGDTVSDHPMRQLMKRPNPLMGEAAFWGHVGTRAAVGGFCVVEKERNRAGQVIALWPLQSAWLRALARRDSSFDWQYRIPGIAEPFLLSAEDVIVFRWADTPSGSPFGMGPLEACLREVAMSNAMLDFIKGMFERGAVPMYGLIPQEGTKRLDQGEVESIIDAFVERRGGLSNAVRPVYMQAIKDIKRLGFDMNELAYNDLHDMTELGIIQAFGIPASVAQLRVGLEHSTSRANVASDEAKLYRQTIIPLWGRFDDALTLGLLSEFEPPNSTRSLEFDTSNIQALQDDLTDKAGWVNSGVAAGWMSVHTAHRELGLPLPPGDDYFLRTLNVQAIPIDDPLGLAAQAAADKKAADQAKAAADAAAAKAAQTPPQPDPNLPPPADQKPPKLASDGPMETLVGVPPSEQYAVRKRIAGSNRAMVNRISNVGTKLLATYFRQAGERIAKQIEAPAGVRLYAANGHGRRPAETLTVANINWDHEEKQLAKTLEKIHSLAGETAAETVSKQVGVGVAWDLANPQVRKVMDQLGTRVVGINQTSKDLVSEAVTSGLEAGKSRSEIADDLKSLFGDWSDSRASTVARTESMLSYGKASAAGYRMTGIVDRIQCFDNPGHIDDYGAEDGLSCAERDELIDDVDSADLHLESEHPNGSLAIAPVLIGAD